MLTGKGFRKTSEVRELLLKAFQVAYETRFSGLEYFQVKVALFVTLFLVYV